MSYFTLHSSYERLDKALLNAKHSNELAEEQRERAENNLRIALKSFDEISTRLAAKQLPQSLDLDISDGSIGVLTSGLSRDDIQVIESLLKFYAEFEKNNQELSNSMFSSTLLHERMGLILTQLGKFDQANDAFDKAFQLLSQSSKSSTAISLKQSNLLNLKGRAYRLAGEFMISGLIFQQSLSILDNLSVEERTIETDFQMVKTLNELIKTRSSQFLQRTQMRGPRKRNHEQNALERLDSEKEFEKSLSIITRLVESSPENNEFQLALAHSYRNILPLVWGKDKDRAEEHHRKAIAILKKLHEIDPDSTLYSYEYADTLAVSEEYRRRNIISEESLGYLKESIKISKKLYHEYPTSLEYALLLASSQRKLGTYYLINQEWEDAEENFISSIGIYKQLRLLYPLNRIINSGLARVRIKLADCERQKGNNDLSSEILREALNDYEAFLNTQNNRKSNNNIINVLTRQLQGRP